MEIEQRGSRDERSGAAAPLRSSRLPPGGSSPALLARVEQLPAGLTHGVAGVLVAAIGFLDAATGAELSFSIFYLLPVLLVAWRLGWRWAAAWSVVAAAVWLAVDVSLGGDPRALVQWWNALVRLGFFLIVAAAVARIRTMSEDQRVLAGTDHLTGVLNGRAFDELIELERSRALRYNRPFTLAYMDVDGFKKVNDELGHSRGDAALQLIAAIMRENVRGMDTVARLGGDEFGLLLPETGTGAADVAIRKVLIRLNEAVAAAELPLTFSIGGVVCVGPPGSVDHLIRRADALMYEVKRKGGGGLRVEVLDDNFGIEAILRRS